jgi:predicted unusual protein kinase regulating ubiquinone biosynthesis (AarF/ABC1/UbiB family)
MSGPPDDERDRGDAEPREAGRLPTGRVARTARIGGLVAGQGLRWAGMRTANRVRTPEKAEDARNDRTAAAVQQLVAQLGQMRGAAMKLGQMLSMVDLDGLPDDQRDDLQRQLAALRDDVPPVPFAKLEKLIADELGGPLSATFREFDRQAFAAASIGQVHRAVTHDGRDVVVKVQYPGVAEAVDTDLRNGQLLIPIIRRIAPGLNFKALAAEMRERIGEELDYELEAQNQRRIERLVRDHPFIRVPYVHTELSTRRVLVSEYVEGERFEDVRRADDATRDRYAEIVFRFFFGLLYRDGIALGDPHPGNYLRCADGRVCFLDFGLLRDIAPERIAKERAIAAAVRAGDADRLKRDLIVGGYVPTGRADAVDADWALRMMRMTTGWYARPGVRRLTPDRAREQGSGERPDRERRAAIRNQVNQFEIPPEAILVRRMHGIVAVVLGQLRAEADWGGIAAEYLEGAPPVTPLGVAEAEYFAVRRGTPARTSSP